MTFCAFLTLYGQPSTLVKAKGILENLPQVKRIDCSADLSQIKLISTEPLHENSLIPLLAQSGISGFRLSDHQTFSRNGLPFSL